MAQIRCSCNRWSQIIPNIRYCAYCSKPLDMDAFAEMVAEDEKMVATHAAIRDTAQRFPITAIGFVFVFLFIMGRFGVGDRLGPLIGTGGFSTIMLSGFLWKEHHEKKLFQMHAKLLSLPNTFRPSIPKP
jgi:hypothetical protein